ncbi:MAG: CoA transferase [Phenylobacterium sp.]|jgi:crotonobetainyl-CoA:carnitine CoA-transferase CaiB-like acyl-CoA transferase|uniref:CaiB/BaiF CoA transferase family protein n=1 Tax=Phenylobacterium sp. TaxID=1871053 RepID=UPI002A36A5C4|nr:CoA transferase [Phenylobacterium sp.]MDX9999362.1 CoA transferase [Phenylobacterium sp.]
MASPLDGLKVLDCTHVIAGAWCSLLLADMGADVIKIEPLEGETTRGHPKARFKAFDYVNRNKRSLAVDLSKPEGQAVIRRLARSADVFVENYRPGALERMGLGYAQLSAENPRLVYASVSGFGHTGPYRDRGGFDLIAQAMSGIMSFTGEVGSTRPTAAGVPLSDLNAGLFAALGVLAALRHRDQSGEGQHVETSLLESAIAYTVWETGLHLSTGEVAKPNGSRHRLAAPYEALKTADGHVVVGVNNERLWARFCQALGDPALKDDPRFADNRARVQNRDALAERIEEVLAGDTTEAWVARFEAAGVPSGPINTIDKALTDPHVTARGLLAEVDGRRFTRTPLQFSKTPVAVKRGPPPLGSSSRDVLAEAGLPPEEIDKLVASGVVGAGEDVKA